MNHLRSMSLFFTEFLLFSGIMWLCLLTACGKEEAEFIFESDIESEENLEKQISETEYCQTESTEDLDVVKDEEKKEEESTISEIRVYICGAVKKAEVITLPIGSRICDAVSLAGGLTEDADSTFVNLAKILSDGEQIYIPTKIEVAEMKEQGQLKQNWENDKEQNVTDKMNQGTVNINTAGIEELCSLCGIGESRARSIIAYREEEGAFQKIEDIMKVQGIKEAAFEKIKDDIVVHN